VFVAAIALAAVVVAAKLGSLKSNILGLTQDPSTADQILGPEVGYRYGAGGAVCVLGATNPRMRIDASLVLALPGRAELTRFLASTSRAGSASYGRHLAPRQFGARFGLPLSRIAALISALEGHGLTVTATYPQRTALQVAGSVATFERDFGTLLHNRIDAQGAVGSRRRRRRAFRRGWAPTCPP